MWGLELLAVIEMSVIPFLMMAASGLVSYDAYKNPEILKFLVRQLGVMRRLVFDRLPPWVSAYIPEFIKGSGDSSSTKEIAKDSAAIYAELDDVLAAEKKSEDDIKMEFIKVTKTKGGHCKVGAKANANYTGSLTDGTVFDSNTKNGKTTPFIFTVGAG